MGLYDNLTYESGEMLGFSQSTLIVLGAILVVSMILRLIVSNISHGFFGVIVRNDTIRQKTVKKGDKALGSVVAYAFSFVTIDLLVRERAENANILMPSWAEYIPDVLQFLLVISIVVWAFRLVSLVYDVVRFLDKDDELDGTEKTLISALESVLRFIIIFVGAIFIADALGFELTSLLAGLGISGLAFALAAKDSISNFFGAITVLLDRPFKVGDWVVIGTSEGEVIEINLRTTLVRTSLDTIITIPNANLVNIPVENWGKRRWRRWQSMVHLDINSDPEKVESFCQRSLDLIHNHDSTTKEDASWCSINTISAQSIDIELNLYWSVDSSIAERKAREALILDLMELAKELDLSFYDGRIRQQR
ncbi:MAG: Low conductance mechanosensitive channel YnaI [Candidatus Poseidoniaceae archaeon]|nr:MAG: Low conductance mechanosensitive channel YnaI [Candidatus Poseidoniaceae archaeon]